MADEDRKYTTIVFIGSLVLTLVSAFIFKSAMLVTIFLII